MFSLEFLCSLFNFFFLSYIIKRESGVVIEERVKKRSLDQSIYKTGMIIVFNQILFSWKSKRNNINDFSNFWILFFFSQNVDKFEISNQKKNLPWLSLPPCQAGKLRTRLKGKTHFSEQIESSRTSQSVRDQIRSARWGVRREERER